MKDSRPIVHLVFVYGTLRKGASNNWRIESAPDSRFLGPATTTGTLLKIDWYPAYLPTGSTIITGDLYEVSPTTLQELDDFEGFTHHADTDEYQRVNQEVISQEQGPLKAWIYHWLGEPSSYPVITSGDWL